MSVGSEGALDYDLGVLIVYVLMLRLDDRLVRQGTWIVGLQVLFRASVHVEHLALLRGLFSSIVLIFRFLSLR